MRVNVVNPNITATMTAKIAAAARAVAAPGTEIIASQPDSGPVSIEGYLDEALSVPGLLQEVVRGERAGAAGHVIACFDDSGLDAARVIARSPVIGIGEAACHVASLIADRFAIVTTLSRSIPALRHNLTRYGLAARCAAIRASDVPVLALDEPGSPARERISDEIARSLRDDGAEAIVLGCAGMADLAEALAAEHGVPVVEGVSAAVKLIEALAALRLVTSKVGAYAPAREKDYSRTPNADLLGLVAASTA